MLFCLLIIHALFILHAKHTRTCFSSSLSNTKHIFDLIHYDLWSPYRQSSLCGSSYFLTIVDDCSRAIWVHLLAKKMKHVTFLNNFML